jgi:hypothetical protein
LLSSWKRRGRGRRPTRRQQCLRPALLQTGRASPAGALTPMSERSLPAKCSCANLSFQSRLLRLRRRSARSSARPVFIPAERHEGHAPGHRSFPSADPRIPQPLLSSVQEKPGQDSATVLRLAANGSRARLQPLQQRYRRCTPSGTFPTKEKPYAPTGSRSSFHWDWRSQEQMLSDSRCQVMASGACRVLRPSLTPCFLSRHDQQPHPGSRNRSVGACQAFYTKWFYFLQ